MPRRNWTREQDLAVLYLKVEIGKSGLTQKHPSIGKLAEAMGRTEASIWMRKGNFDSLDDSVPVKGLGNAAPLTRNVWEEYESNTERILAEARNAYSNLV